MMESPKRRRGARPGTSPRPVTHEVVRAAMEKLEQCAPVSFHALGLSEAEALDARFARFTCVSVDPKTGVSKRVGRCRVPVLCVSLSKDTKLLAHKVVACFGGGMDYAEHERDGEMLDVSHLCGSGGCLRREHLCFEPHSVNMSRISCPGFFYIRGLPPELFCFCEHTPRCEKLSVRTLAQVTSF
jgi:hypothetical protein